MKKARFIAVFALIIISLFVSCSDGGGWSCDHLYYFDGNTASCIYCKHELEAPYLLKGEGFHELATAPFSYEGGSVFVVTDEKADYVLNTNGQPVIIDAPNATIRHYGSSDNVEIDRIASNSYHLNGETKKINVFSGRVVLENNSSVDSIVLVYTDVIEGEPVVISAASEYLIPEIKFGFDIEKNSSYSFSTDIAGVKSDITVEKDGDGAVEIKSTNSSSPIVSDLVKQVEEAVEKKEGVTYGAQIGNKKYIDLDAALSSVKSGSNVTVKLLEDYSGLAGIPSLDFNTTTNITLDLNGKTISASNRSGLNGRFIIINNANLTIVGPGVICPLDTISQSMFCIKETTGFVTIKGGTISTTNLVYDSTNTGNLKIEGGEFADLVAAVNHATSGASIKLLSDVAAPNTSTNLMFAENVTLDLNGKTIKNGDFRDYKDYEFSGSKFTIKNGTMEGVFSQSAQGYCYGMYIDGLTTQCDIVTLSNLNFKNGGLNINNTKNVVVNNCSVEMTNTNAYYSICVQADTGFVSSATVKNGTFGKGTNGNVAYIDGGEANKLTIENGAFDGNFYFTGGSNGILEVKGGSFTDLASAAKYATSATSIKLLADTCLSERLVVDKALTIDLNGKTVSYSGSSIDSGIIGVKRGGNLTINDTSSAKTGKIESGANAYAAIAITVKGDSTATNADFAKFTLNGGTLSGDYYGIVGNGNRHNTEIVINGGTVKGNHFEDNYGIYNPQDGKVTINGGSIEGYNAAIEMRAGNLVITSGTFESKASPATIAPNGNGTTIKGAAVAVSQHNTNKNLAVSISGGTFNGARAVYEEDIQDTIGTDLISLSITGGTFNGEIYSENCTGFVKGGSFSMDPASYLASGYQTRSSRGMYVVSRQRTW